MNPPFEITPSDDPSFPFKIDMCFAAKGFVGKLSGGYETPEKAEAGLAYAVTEDCLERLRDLAASAFGCEPSVVEFITYADWLSRQEN